jgi:hypothetical protein
MSREVFQKVGVEPRRIIWRTDDGIIPYVKLETSASDTPLPVSLPGDLVINAEIGNIVSVAPSDNLTLSEFGEQRTAEPGNRSDGEFLYDLQPLLYDNISANGGTATHVANGRHILLAVGGSETNRVGGMRKHYWTPYTPGNGQEIDITGTLNAANLEGGTAEVFLRSTVTGVTTLQTVPQADWIAAKDDAHWQYSQIFRMSFQSLRVGRIQFSLARNGGIVKVAEITNDNIRATGYWQYASLPPYWKIYHDDGKTVAEFGYGDELNGIGFRYVFPDIQADATAIAICETVKSQGGERLKEIPGFPFTTAPMAAARTASTTIVPVISIRVAATFNSIENRSLVIPTGFEIETTHPINWFIYYRPTLTSPTWGPNDTHSGVEVDVVATAITGGYLFEAGMLGAGNNQRVQEAGLLDRVLMSLGSTGTADILTIAAVRSGAQDASVRALIKGKAIR